MLVCKTADNAIRWKEGERLDHLFQQRCDQLEAEGEKDHLAIDIGQATFTFRDLDDRANQVARYLAEQGIGSGDRVALLFDRSVETYVALLAVLKVNAAYIPLDASFPKERMGFILQDAGAKAIVSLSEFRATLDAFALPLIVLDNAKVEIDAKATGRLTESERTPPANELCYIVYTSGTTGNPKGVAVGHPSICNFVKVAGEVYGIGPRDRVYQGMTIAFDFSVEELWVPLIAGATLVPGKPGTSLVGDDLEAHLRAHKVTVLCCVPTLLATIEQDLPDLRILLVSGEACPQNLVRRWHRPGRTILNAYGPTEATVTATLAKLHPDNPVTIGGPLPTYSIVILDENKDEVLQKGALGEIGIAGIGLADGYLNRDDLTEKKFIPDFLNIPGNPSKRIYRTGDVGRINDHDEVEFHGRIDTQVKMRGYRIELGEIEVVISKLPQVAQAVVHTYEPKPGTVELVAYYTRHQGAPELALSEVSKTLRMRLPGYMIPAYFEELPAFPMTGSNKADRKRLPAPTGPRLAAGSGQFVAPRTEREKALAGALVTILKVDRVSVKDNFFHDLGAHSLLLARFCSAIRREWAMANVSMRDIYLNPTIEKLAQQLGSSAEEAVVDEKRDPLRIPSDLEYYGCGALQLLFYMVFGLFTLWVLVTGITWTYAAVGNVTELYVRIVAFLVASFVGLSAIPIAAKWLLVGRWRQDVFPVWSLRYLCLWVVKTLIRSAPVAALAGSPIYNVYLRLLGARVGRNAVIESRTIPVCTDLISIGNNAVIRKEAVFTGYKAQSNRIYTGPVHIGDDAYVGVASVLDIDATMEDGTQLGHASSLQSGQCALQGKRYHGSPAQETPANFCDIDPKVCTPQRRAFYSAFQLTSVLAIYMPLFVMMLYYLYSRLAGQLTGTEFNLEAPWSGLLSLAVPVLFASAALFFGALLIGLLIIGLVPRLLMPFLARDKTYVLYGAHYVIYRAIAWLSNSPVHNLLFGDSNYIVTYFRWVGYRLIAVVQTGSNFGCSQRHDNPFLCSVGSGTMVSDGLMMINAVMSSSSFKLSEVRIGDRNYLGNGVHYPAGGKTGDNCLLGTKVMVPIDGPIRVNIGLLGSPPFEIPRVVDRDKLAIRMVEGEARRKRIAKKLRHNSITIVAFLLCHWLHFFVLLFAGYVGLVYYPVFGIWSLFVFSIFASLFSIGFFTVVEHGSLGFKKLQPRLVSMYDDYFWLHERYWKLSGHPLSSLFKGTPFKNFISRLLGVGVGKKVFDDGCRFIDKSLIEVGDYTNFNELCIVHGHSLEEGIFKTDRIKIGKGCSIGLSAFVHYGVSMGDNVLLGADSFLMKGESPDPGTTWRGNPAKAVCSVARQSPLVEIVLPSVVAPAPQTVEQCQ
ncbi:MAG: Pls/PosA family non-ribosomal peptide synthetase [Hyphomicrobium sp.]